MKRDYRKVEVNQISANLSKILKSFVDSLNRNAPLVLNQSKNSPQTDAQRQAINEVTSEYETWQLVNEIFVAE